jgi:hypothetical protein
MELFLSFGDVTEVGFFVFGGRLRVELDSVVDFRFRKSSVYD